MLNVGRKAHNFARGAYETAHKWAPQARKFAAGARRAYEAASPMIDEYGGRHAGNVHNAAKRGFEAYDQLERAAMQGDAVIRAARG
jgi:hypothetical protein